jgi:HK97 family phage prohead protease
LNHDPNLLLARSGNGLTLKEDDTGLYYEFPVDENDPDHLRVAAKLERGDLSGSSFGFEPVERRFIEFRDYDVVELVKVRLYDVSPATFPAYEGTSVGIRSTDGMEKLKQERDAWKRGKQVEYDERVAKQAKAEAGIL